MSIYNKYITISLLGISTLLGCVRYSPYKYENKTVLIKPVINYDKRFEDQNIDIRFQLEKKRILFFLKNKTADTIKILWGKVSYVDPDGNTHPAVSTKTLFSKKMSEPDSTSIDPGIMIRDVIVPVDNVLQANEEWSWNIKPLFDMTNEEALKNTGKIFSVIMPMEINDKVIDYQFNINIYYVAPQEIIIN